MSELIADAGAIAGAISAVIALVTAVAIKPFLAARKRRREARRAESEFREQVLARLSVLNEDIAELQCDRLSQAHDFYLSRGWCTSSKKAQLCEMYRSYMAKGRNHLSHYYEQEILALPDSPDDIGK